MPPLSFGHFPRTAGEPYHLSAPFTLTLALSHRGRGEYSAPPPRAYPARFALLARAPFALRNGLVVRCLVWGEGAFS